VLEAARTQCRDVTVPWDTATVGIFGEVCARSVLPRDGDRIELYRPLRIDPKEARRSRARPRAS
jgi:putative ubiquitin-RnfH superfamily antitoxin RatB of RatAB toxin-antitoxin module